VQPTAVVPAEKPSIAVLPFVNMSNDPDQEYFSDGMAEDILNGFAKNPGLTAKARTSSFRFEGQNRDIREIGKALNANHIVEGSVRKAASRIRVTAQLISSAEDAHIWSEQYNRDLVDIFAVQDGIVTAILEELSIRLLSQDENRGQTTNMAAYDAYLMGRYRYRLQQLDETIAAFEKAVSIDPDFADAYGMLALTHNDYIWATLAGREKLPIVRHYISKALSLDPNQLEASLSRTAIRFYFDRAYQEVIDECTELARNHPDDTNVLWSYSYLLLTIGRPELAHKINDRMVQSDPFNPTAHLVQGVVFLYSGRFADAYQSFLKGKALGFDEPFLLAEVGFASKNPKMIQEQLDRGQAHWGLLAHWYPVWEAAIPYIDDDSKTLQELLRDIGLDEESIAKLKIPPLPF